jgi:hypothetical protein
VFLKSLYWFWSKFEYYLKTMVGMIIVKCLNKEVGDPGGSKKVGPQRVQKGGTSEGPKKGVF